MAGKSTLRKSPRRARTAVAGAVLAAGAVTGALALGGAAWAGSSDPGVVSAESDNVISTDEYDAALPFFEAGYTYDDAVVLAEQWESPSAYDAKITGGEKLAAGEALPVEPSGTPTTAEELAAGLTEAQVAEELAAGGTQ